MSYEHQIVRKYSVTGPLYNEKREEKKKWVYEYYDNFDWYSNSVSLNIIELNLLFLRVYLTACHWSMSIFTFTFTFTRILHPVSVICLTAAIVHTLQCRLSINDTVDNFHSFWFLALQLSHWFIAWWDEKFDNLTIQWTE